MLLESVIAANTAFAIVKKAIQNGKEIGDCAKAVGAYLGHKEKVEEEVNKSSGANSNDLEAFYQLEKLNKAEADLKFLMQKTRLGMWQDFEAFKNKRKVLRANAVKAQAKAKARRDSEWAATLDALYKAFFLIIALGGIAWVSIYMIYNFER
tara:strand:- start:16 stop:471 length:456 start_codon:yes stop_codon:yes gene_type:complete